jgi:HSP20 family protein
LVRILIRGSQARFESNDSDLHRRRPAGLVQQAEPAPSEKRKPSANERNTVEPMNTLNRWNSLHSLQEFKNRVLEAFSPGVDSPSEGRETMAPAEWAPLVNIAEDMNEYLLVAELPEVKKEDVRVTVENGLLSIAGERRFEKEAGDRKWHRVERGYGSFARIFALPENADSAKIKAEFKEGVLKVHLTKSEAARPKQIEVEVG